MFDMSQMFETRRLMSNNFEERKLCHLLKKSIVPKNVVKRKKSVSKMRDKILREEETNLLKDRNLGLNAIT